jgi:DNA-binding NarL/FixJ family response regulator
LPSPCRQQRRGPQAGHQYRIVVLPNCESDINIYQGLRRGAKGYLLAQPTRDRIVEAVVAVHCGCTDILSLVGEKLATGIFTG